MQFLQLLFLAFNFKPMWLTQILPPLVAHLRRQIWYPSNVLVNTDNLPQKPLVIWFCLVIWKKTSPKWKSCFCKKSFATSVGLYLATSPFGFNFTLYNYLTILALFPGGSGVSLQVWFFSIDLSSSLMATIRFISFSVFSKLIHSISDGLSHLQLWLLSLKILHI